MEIALEEANKAYFNGDVPVGAVIVKDGKIIAKAHNLREKEKITVGHAEILAISEANKALGSWRLSDCDIYVTLEPCFMCASAIMQANIRSIYFGALDNKTGAFSSELNINNFLSKNNKINVYPGILEEKCSFLLKEFFKEKRN